MAKYNKTQMYFFKFPESFFDTDEIEELSYDVDGDSIIILYLKLITIAMNKCGYLCKIISGELKPYSVGELAKKTKTDELFLKEGIQRLNKIGLIELKDSMLYIQEALNYTNQTVSAKKKQNQRNNNKVDKCPLNCPPDRDNRNQNLDNRNQKLDIRNKEKRNNNCSFEQQEEIPYPALQDICYRIIDYLNRKAFKHYHHDTKATIGLIKLRLSEGYTEEDFYTVIDKMTECWLSNGKLEMYLRPSTLFSSNFEGYLTGNWIRQEADWSSNYKDDYDYD